MNPPTWFMHRVSYCISYVCSYLFKCYKNEPNEILDFGANIFSIAKKVYENLEKGSKMICTYEEAVIAMEVRVSK